MNNQQIEKLQKIQVTLIKWQQELADYQQWAIDNDGLLDEQEQAEISRRMHDIHLINERIKELSVQNTEEEDLDEDEGTPKWEFERNAAIEKSRYSI